jgi:protein phosphatase
VDYLRSLPLRTVLEREGTSFFLTHATPSDPMYGHHAPESDGWISETESAGTDVLLVGHSHVPFIRKVGRTTLLNPGSIGQSRNGDIRASYAVWEDGRFSLRTYAYPVEETIHKIEALSFPEEVEEDLVSILRTGRV